MSTETKKLYADRERSLERVQASGVMSLDRIDFTIQNPETVAARLGGSILFSARVENEVFAEGLQTLMPLAGTTYRGYESKATEFIDEWVPQEEAHGLIQNTLLGELGIEPIPVERNTPWHNHALGFLDKMSPWLHQVIEMVYYSQGTMQELLTNKAYSQMYVILQGMGEKALAHTLFKPMMIQESVHSSFYKNAAAYLGSKLSERQLRYARKIIQKTFTPVGAGADKHKPHIGHMMIALGGERVEEFAEPVQRAAQELLDLPNGDATVVHALQECIDAHRDTPYVPQVPLAA